MVSAVIAEATRSGVNIKRTDGTVIAVRRARLEDSSDAHGINRDEADEIVEQAGYIAGVWRWQPEGYYKAVVAPAGPQITEAEARDWQRRQNERQQQRSRENRERRNH